MNKEIIIKELEYKAIRSSGAGGQHVNKVSSKVVLSFDVANSEGLSEQEKSRLYQKWSSKLTKENILLLACEDSKSQLQNKNKVTERLFILIKKGLYVPKRRIATKPTKSSIKRVKAKKQKRGEIKKNRRRPRLED